MNTLQKFNIFKVNLMHILLIGPLIFYIGTEASSSRSFILLGLISILPDIVSSINRNKNKQDYENL